MIIIRFALARLVDIDILYYKLFSFEEDDEKCDHTVIEEVLQKLTDWSQDE